MMDGELYEALNAARRAAAQPAALSLSPQAQAQVATAAGAVPAAATDKTKISDRPDQKSDPAPVAEPAQHVDVRV